MRAIVDLPEPLSPTRPKVSPCLICRLTSRVACRYLRLRGEDSVLGNETQIQVLDFEKVLAATVFFALPQPMGRNVDLFQAFGSRLDVLYQGETINLDTGARYRADQAFGVIVFGCRQYLCGGADFDQFATVQ